MHLARTVVDAERPDLAKHLLHDGIARHAHSAEDLHAPIRDPEERLRYGHFRHAGFTRARVPFVQYTRAPVDHQLRLLQLYEVVGEHEPHALVLDDRFAEGVPPTGVLGGHVVSPARGAPPTHAVRQPRRRETPLRV